MTIAHPHADSHTELNRSERNYPIACRTPLNHRQFLQAFLSLTTKSQADGRHND